MTVAIGTKPQISPFQYRRFPTREVLIGSVGVGGSNPIRLQSMTTADTMDTAATVREAIALYEAGSEIVRITAPGPRDAENLGEIKRRLREQGYDFPLVADIHFSPKAALIAVEHVEKVRINPGNYSDQKKFKIREYTPEEYAAELQRVREIFHPLVRRAKELGRALRIGTNHGSLSDRIMNQFGDTPAGMVESALEFIYFARELDFHDIVVSMKASNPQVMVQAYRLLVNRFIEEGLDYPLHLGVTEAGYGQDGRLKSAVGIGALLDDGIGDTIRVSLTEDPVAELPAARTIAERYQHPDRIAASVFAIPPDGVNQNDVRSLQQIGLQYNELFLPDTYSRKLSEELRWNADGWNESFRIGGQQKHTIVLPLTAAALEHPGARGLIKRLHTDGADAFYISRETARKHESLIQELSTHYPLFIEDDFRGQQSSATRDITHAELNTAELRSAQIPAMSMFATETVSSFAPPAIERGLYLTVLVNAEMPIKSQLDSWCRNVLPLLPEKTILSLQFEKPYRPEADPFASLARAYRLFYMLVEKQRQERMPPIVLRATYAGADQLVFDAGIDLGALLLDGIGDGVCMPLIAEGEIMFSMQAHLDLLQAVRLRLSKTEFISCPSCGRTLFDLQSTTERIKQRTGHLKGVKIAVMGCIVNGPGEMADADFGYVGAGPGRIHLYLGKEIVKNNIPAEIADEELVALIKAHGMWSEPTPVQTD